MPQGGTIRVSASNAEIGAASELPLAEGRYVRVSISDSGNGIPPENMTKIFDPYFTTKESGTGLGLATAYSVMKKHRGYVGVNSRVGLGSTFFCYIPTSQVEPRKGPSEKNFLVKGSGRVLIMDDDEGIRTLAEAILSEIGYQVVTVRDGNECLKEYHSALLDNRFDVVVMDLTVPGGMGGKEAIQHLRRIDPTVKAVVSSGYSNDPIMSDYEHHGFVDVLTKPYDAATLSHVLGKITASVP
jgi:CheY-like chemotaxis protein